MTSTEPKKKRHPRPPVEDHVDLRNFSYMPLEVDRLLRSDTWAIATGDEFKAALTLWCVAWHNVPAGSLLDDDFYLAAKSGAAQNWGAVKKVALRGWLRANNGLLYHPLLSKKVNETWAIKFRNKTKTAAATKARKTKTSQRDGSRNGQRDDQRHVSRDVQRDDDRDVQRDDDRDVQRDESRDKRERDSKKESSRRKTETPPLNATKPDEGFRGDEISDRQKKDLDSDAALVATYFIIAKTEEFPDDPNPASCQASLETQAGSWIRQGIDPTDLCSMVGRGMVWFREKGRTAPTSLSAFHRSFEDHLAKTRAADNPEPEPYTPTPEQLDILNLYRAMKAAERHVEAKRLRDWYDARWPFPAEPGRERTGLKAPQPVLWGDLKSEPKNPEGISA